MWQFVLGAFVPWINLKIDWLWQAHVSAHNKHIGEQYLFCCGSSAVHFVQSRESTFCTGKHTFTCLKMSMQEQSVLATLVFISYCLLASCLLNPLPPFSSRLFISTFYLLLSLLFSPVVHHHSCSLFFSSLSKEPDVVLVWFIQMQRLGLRDSAAGRMHSARVQIVAYTSYCHSSCKWVFLIYMNRTFHFLWIEYIASLVRT